MIDIRRSGELISRARTYAQLSQAELAAKAGTSQPSIARLEQPGSNPTISTLVRSAAAAGYAITVQLIPLAPSDPVVELYKRDVDRTLLRENLRKSYEDRLSSLGEWQESMREIALATRKRTVKP